MANQVAQAVSVIMGNQVVLVVLAIVVVYHY
jgi:hypothetical protein